MHIGRLMRATLPNESKISKPAGMPALPISNKKDLKNFEAYLGQSDVNLAAVVCYLNLILSY